MPTRMHESKFMKKAVHDAMLQMRLKWVISVVSPWGCSHGLSNKYILTFMVNILKISLNTAKLLYLFYECIAKYAGHVIRKKNRFLIFFGTSDESVQIYSLRYDDVRQTRMWHKPGCRIMMNCLNFNGPR